MLLLALLKILVQGESKVKCFILKILRNIEILRIWKYCEFVGADIIRPNFIKLLKHKPKQNPVQSTWQEYNIYDNGFSRSKFVALQKMQFRLLPFYLYPLQ